MLLVNKISTLCIVLILIINSEVNAQANSKIEIFQDSLIKISNQIQQISEKEDKIIANANFVKTLVEALKLSHSFNFTFDSLKNVSFVKSPDQHFRVISWYLPFEDGTYRYYGAIQMKTSNGSLKLYPLTDKSESIVDQNIVTTNSQWIGARYYEVIPVTSNRTAPYYILLGWKGKNINATQKIIEILTFNEDTVKFGAPNFEGKSFKDKNRIIFHYNKENTMILKSDPNAGMIVFDNLIPIEPNFVGKYDYYVSDGTMNGFKVIGGKLVYMDNIDLKNEENINDNFYADPNKKNSPPRKF